MEQLYPDLPQELGGVHPRCGYLDIDKTQLSLETLKSIVLLDSQSSGSEIEILFSGRDLTLIRSDKEFYELENSVT